MSKLRVTRSRSGASAPRDGALRRALRETGVVAAWALCAVGMLVAATLVVVVVAGSVIPWCMVTLASGLGVGAETSLVDLVFVYGASALFVVLIMAALAIGAIRAAGRTMARARDWAVTRLRRAPGDKSETRSERR